MDHLRTALLRHDCYPKKERALATGIFNAGANVGAIVAPLVVPGIATRYGWRWAFIVTGATGFAWLAGWLAIYRKPTSSTSSRTRSRVARSHPWSASADSPVR